MQLCGPSRAATIRVIQMSPLQQRALTQLNDERDRPARLGVVSETVANRKLAPAAAECLIVAKALTRCEMAHRGKRSQRGEVT
jgi:hypothetical protein